MLDLAPHGRGLLLQRFQLAGQEAVISKHDEKDLLAQSGPIGMLTSGLLQGKHDGRTGDGRGVGRRG